MPPLVTELVGAFFFVVSSYKTLSIAVGVRQSFAFQATKVALVSVAGAFTLPAARPAAKAAGYYNALVFILLSSPRTNPAVYSIWNPSAGNPFAVAALPEFGIKSTWSGDWGMLTLDSASVQNDKMLLSWTLINTTTHDISYYFLIGAEDNNSNKAFDMSYGCENSNDCGQPHALTPGMQVHYANSFTINYADTSLKWIKIQLKDGVGNESGWMIPLPDR